MDDDATIESAVPPKVVLRMANPLMKALLRSPLHGATSSFMLLLSFKGRKSGRAILVPVSYHVVDDVITAFTAAPWLSNLEDDAPLEIVYKGARRRAKAEIVDDPDLVAGAVRRVLEAIGPKNASRFAFRVKGGIPSLERVRSALAGRKMLRLHLAD